MKAIAFVAVLLVSAFPLVMPTAAAAHTSPPAVFDAKLDTWFLGVTRGGVALGNYTSAIGPLRPGDDLHFYWNLSWSATAATGCAAPGAVRWSTATDDTVDLTIVGGGASVQPTDATDTGVTDERHLHLTTTFGNAVTNTTNGLAADVFAPLRYTLVCNAVTTEDGWFAGPEFRSDPLLYTLQPSTLVHTQTGRGGAMGESVATLNWLGGNAQVKVDGTLVSATTGVASGYTTPAKSTNLGTYPTYQIVPINQQTNAPDTTKALTFTFPTMDVDYGPAPSANPAFLVGSAMGTLHVNTTGRAEIGYPGGATPGSSVHPLGFQLLRQTGTAGLQYWNVGQSGGSDTTTHFASASQPDTAATNPTRFQPAGLPSAGKVPGTTTLQLTNLTSRSFIEGNYSLEGTFVGDNRNTLRQTIHFFIDNDAPAKGTPRNYTSTLAPLFYGDNGLDLQDGVLHGGDGNPLRVSVNFTDYRTTASNGAILDVGLRNVTIELVDASTGLPVKRTAPGPGEDAYARVNITPEACGGANSLLPYCKNLLPAPTASSACLATPPTYDETLACYQARLQRTNQSFTFVNGTSDGTWKQFSGWVNLTWPDLPVGTYKVRQLAFDQKGALAREQLSSSVYQVVPNVRIATTSTSPALVGNVLDVNVATSQRLADEFNGAGSSTRVSQCDSAQPDVCPADYVEIFVTNDNTAAYTNTQKVKKWDNRTSFLASTRDNVDVIGWGKDPTYYAVNGTLSPTVTNSIPYFRYVDSNKPPLESGGGIDVTKQLYVKARAVHMLPSGARVANETEWIPVISSGVSGLLVNQPPTPWSFALSGASAPKDRVAYNLTYDRGSIRSTIPQMSYTITGNGATISSPARNPENAIANALRYNWSGSWPEAGATALAPGDYTVRASVTDGGELKAEAWHNFTVLGSAPKVVINAADQGSPTVHVTGTGNSQTIYGRNEFDISFQIEHGALNLTSLDQLVFNLTPASPRGSIKPMYGPIRWDSAPDEGFSVELRPGSVLSEAASISYFNATVTFPSNPEIRSGDIFGLEIKSLVDVAPWRAGNATATPRLILDTEFPNASVRPLETAASVLSFPATNPPTNANPVAPVFKGQIKDNASGVKRIDVRIVDTVKNKSIYAQGDVWVEAPADADFWMTTDLVTVGSGSTEHQLRNVFLTAPGADGIAFWQVNATSRWIFVNGLEQNKTTAAPNGIKADDMPFNLAATYRVDVRSLDNVGQLSDIRSTLVKLDPVGPTLGYNGALSTPSTIKSGIHSAVTTVPWHGSATLTVNATDNHCLAAVRLVGKSDLNPSTIVKANMTVVPKAGMSADQTRCDKGQPIEWTLNLANAAQMTNDVSNYTYWFEAEDVAGLVTEVAAPYRTFRMWVTDATPASVLSVLLNPPIAADGLRSRVEANVIENEALRNVTVVARYANNQTFIAKVDMKPDPARPPAANGTGWYVADTTDDLGITLHVGDYLFEVTARDINYNRTCGGFCIPGTGLLRVVADAPPQVTQESPPRGTVFVGAQPTLKFQVLDRNMETSGIKVEAGNGTLSTVTANFSEIKALNGSRQGYEVAYTPATAFTDGMNITVKITATSTKGFTNVSSFDFTVDAMPPTVSANLTGNLTLAGKSWAVSTTSINITSDAGASSIRTKINGVDATYSGPITPSGNDGEWRLEYWAVDAANNSAPHQFVNLSIDKTGPVIRASRHGDDVIVTVDDAGVGVDEANVTVHYSYGTDAFAAKRMDKLTGNSYNASLGGNASATGLRYWFDARDALGNVGANYSAAAPYTITKEGDVVVPPPENEPPTVVISSPTGTPTIAGNLEIRWVAQDPEGAPISITIALNEPEPGRVLVTGSENSGSYVLNTTGYPPANYTIVVTASDGEETGRATASFVIAGETIKLIDPPPARVESDEQVSFGVSIEPVGKTVQQATYTIVKAGRAVQSGQLRAVNGVYTGSVTPPDAGDYRVFVSVAYSDGSTDPAKQVAQFSVSGTVTPPDTGRASFPVSLIGVVILAVIIVGLGGYGAFGRWKK